MYLFPLQVSIEEEAIPDIVGNCQAYFLSYLNF